jgi:hypothetical protein
MKFDEKDILIIIILILTLAVFILFILFSINFMQQRITLYCEKQDNVGIRNYGFININCSKFYSEFVNETSNSLS